MQGGQDEQGQPDAWRSRWPIGPVVGALGAGSAGPSSRVRLMPLASTSAANVASDGARASLS